MTRLPFQEELTQLLAENISDERTDRLLRQIQESSSKQKYLARHILMDACLRMELGEARPSGAIVKEIMARIEAEEGGVAPEDVEADDDSAVEDESVAEIPRRKRRRPMLSSDEQASPKKRARFIAPLAAAAILLVLVGFFAARELLEKPTGAPVAVAHIVAVKRPEGRRVGGILAKSMPGVEREIEKGAVIVSGETLSTLPGGYALMKLSDGTMVDLNENTIVTFPVGAGREDLLLEFGETFFACAKRSADRRPFSARTISGASAEALGTKFELTCGGDASIDAYLMEGAEKHRAGLTTTLRVEEGTVRFLSGTGESWDVKALEESAIKPGGAPTEPVSIAVAAIAPWRRDREQAMAPLDEAPPEAGPAAESAPVDPEAAPREPIELFRDDFEAGLRNWRLGIIYSGTAGKTAANAQATTLEFAPYRDLKREHLIVKTLTREGAATGCAVVRCSQATCPSSGMKFTCMLGIIPKKRVDETAFAVEWVCQLQMARAGKPRCGVALLGATVERTLLNEAPPMTQGKWVKVRSEFARIEGDGRRQLWEERVYLDGKLVTKAQVRLTGKPKVCLAFASGDFAIDDVVIFRLPKTGSSGGS